VIKIEQFADREFQKVMFEEELEGDAQRDFLRSPVSKI
jgi:hypothetical protein